jgi:flagellar hook-length control protein FliK
MNQLVAFLVPTSLPNTAGAMVHATSTQPSETFADVLAQLQAATPPNATIDPSAQPSQLLAQLPTGLPQAADALSTDELALKLQAIDGVQLSDDAAKPHALTTLLDPATSLPAPKADAAEADPETALLALVATQLQSQAPVSAPAADTAPTTHTAPTTPAELGLRGTLAAEQTTAPKIFDTALGQEPADSTLEHAAPAGVLAGGQRPKSETQPRTGLLTPARRTADAPGANTPTQAPASKPTETSDEPPAPKSATPQSQGHSSLPAQGNTPAAAKPADTVPAQSSFVPTTSVQPTLVDTQHMTATVITSPQAAVPLDALAVHIARKFEAGASQFEIRLHPAELGQLDISLSVAEDGRVQAVLRAERPDTLDILQRDARALEQQLRQAGLEVGSNSLSFSLSSGNGQRQAPFAGWPAFADAQDAAEQAKKEAASTYIAVRQRDGVDIRV